MFTPLSPYVLVSLQKVFSEHIQSTDLIILTCDMNSGVKGIYPQWQRAQSVINAINVPSIFSARQLYKTGWAEREFCPGLCSEFHEI